MSEEEAPPVCASCGSELVSVSGDPEDAYQFHNALWIGFFGGYGMFVDDVDVSMGNVRRTLRGAAREAVLCHACAHALCEQQPWMAKLIKPFESHSHRADFWAAHPEHEGWDQPGRAERLAAEQAARDATLSPFDQLAVALSRVVARAEEQADELIEEMNTPAMVGKGHYARPNGKTVYEMRHILLPAMLRELDELGETMTAAPIPLIKPRARPRLALVKRIDAFRDSLAHTLTTFVLEHIATPWYRKQITTSTRLGLEKVSYIALSVRLLELAKIRLEQGATPEQVAAWVELHDALIGDQP